MNADLMKLQECFVDLPDHRVEGRILHLLNDILVLTICAVVCGANDWDHVEMWGIAKIEWLRKFVPLKNGIPSPDTIGRVFAAIDNKCFQACFIRWVSTICTSVAGEVVAIDGKTMRGSHHRRLGKNAIHVVSAFAAAQGITLGQLSTDVKSNEITAIPALLDVLDIKGSTVTIDAMGCQTGIVKKIVDKGADYVLGLKGNQGNLHVEIKDFFETAERESYRALSTIQDISYDKGHGRLETRRCVALSTVYLETAGAWMGLKSMVMVESIREIIGEKITSDKRFFISSHAPDSKALANAIRSHWAIENQLHWCLDVTFNEDGSRIRKDNAPENFNAVRKIAMNLLKRTTSRKLTLPKKRLLALLDEQYLEEVLGMNPSTTKDSGSAPFVSA
jgi:predicted transposase YbfD/YdcC